jgi:5' nucleotidase family
VNRSLYLEKIKFFGFDMDYTLAGIHSIQYGVNDFCCKCSSTKYFEKKLRNAFNSKLSKKCSLVIDMLVFISLCCTTYADYNKDILV